MSKYNIYPGSFVCHTCKVEVKTLRLYTSEKKLTWMCPERHISMVNLNTKKSRKDYE